MEKTDSKSRKLLLAELKSCYNFFSTQTNLDKNSKGYGLVRDKYPLSPTVSSIAAVGYGLGSLIVGVNNNWIDFDEAKTRAVGTLKTVLNNLQETNGFYYHFINLKNGVREWKSEVSIIDTGIFLCGALSAGEFFGDEVKELANKTYSRVNWQWYTDEKRNMFHMGYTPEKNFEGHWDVYAEQLMLYVLGAAAPKYSIDKSLYETMGKLKGEYGKNKDIIHSWFGSLFTYQFSHAWIDFRNTQDENGIDWFENSIKASLANYEYCIDNKKSHKTFGKKSWGITAGVCPAGYSGEFGAMPAGHDIASSNDGTIAPYGAVSSVCFTPRESLVALKKYYSEKNLIGIYGLKAAYNLDGNKPWYSNEFIGIDKGITMMMIENFLNETMWSNFMKNEHVQKGMEINKIKKLKL